MSKVNHVFLIRNRAIRCQRLIENLLEMKELEYEYYMLEMGWKYLRVYLKNDELPIKQLEQSATFWGWWKNQWLIREEEYLQRYDEWLKIGMDFKKAAWVVLHKPEALAAELHPRSKSLGDSFAEMIDMAFEEARQKQLADQINHH